MMFRHRKIVVIAGFTAVIIVAFIMMSGRDWPSLSVVGADSGNPEQVAIGQVVYQENCASCHGVEGEGQPNWRTRNAEDKLPAPPHDESGHTWHHSDQVLFQITKHGLQPPLAPFGYKSDMPAFMETLSDEQIWAVLAYIKSLWPAPTQARQDRMNEADN